MKPREPKDKNEDVLCRILDSAAEVFSDSGFAGARMDHIADRAGVNKATIYYHIGNKKTLYGKILHDHFASAVDRFDQALADAKTPEEKLSCFIHQIAHEMEQHPFKATMLLREAIEGGENVPEIVARDVAGIIGRLMGILADGEKEGRFINVNPLTIHMLVLGSLAFYRVSAPVREKIFQVMDPPNAHAAYQNGGFINEIEQLILRSISK